MILRGALVLLFCLLVASPVRADSNAAIAVRGVDVDVTAADAVTAREKAVLDGQRKALQQALAMLTQPADVARLPGLSDQQITDLLVDYEVEQERASTVRYIGKLAFRFRADVIGDLLQKNGVPYSAAESGPVLLLPVLTVDGRNLLWEDGNLWRDFWVKHAPASGLVPLRLPRGDEADRAAITADQAVAGDPAKLQALAQRYGISDVVVAVAERAGDSPAVALTVKRFGMSGPASGFQDKFDGSTSDPDAAFELAVDRVIVQLQQDWIDQNRVTSTAEQNLTVEAPIADFSQWAELRRRLASIGTLRRVDVVYLMRSRAELALTYVGDRDQLARALQQRALTLRDSGDGHTLLEPAAAGQP
jgi:Uncharacterized protein conserved in bacteria (DUF2066)